MTTAKGDVRLQNNSLFIKPLDTTLQNLSGNFSFVNGDLNSQTLSATRFNQPLNLNFSTREGEKAFLVDVGMNANWQPSRTGLLPKAVSEALSGSVPWDGKVAIELPYHGNASYKVDINGDLKNVSSRLPSPVSKPAGEPLPVKINVAGGLSSFDLTGSIGAKNHINSRWLLNHKLTLDRAILTTDSKGHSPLPDQPGIELNLPPMDGAQWLALFENGAANEVSSSVLFPPRIVLRTPSLALAGQQWNNVSLMSQPVAGGSQVEAQGREINATLTMRDNAPWLANVRYLYFNPASASGQNATENVAPRRRRGWISMAGPICSYAARNAGCGDKNIPHRWGCGDQRGYLNALQRHGGYRVWPADDQRRVGERPFRGSNLAERQTARQ